MNTVIEQIDLPADPFAVFLRLPERVKGLSFLTSDGSQGSRWSILAWDPSDVVEYREGEDHQAFQRQISSLITSRQQSIETHLPFVGGLIGSLDYEYGYELLDLEQKQKGSVLVRFGVYDKGLVFDHQEQQWYRFGDPEVSLQETPQRDMQALQLKPTWDQVQYQQRFDELKELIRQGECYQACLTFPFVGPAVADPRALFEQLWSRHPAPMAAYLEQNDRQILSMSPERFIHWDGETIETKPIKGTRKRGRNPEEDQLISEQILESEKERAELNMITDLLRNDLARVSLPGTVRVLEHQSLQKLPHLWHVYSHIQAQTRPQTTAWDIIRAVFPGGSISGCPKRRAVQALTELEDTPREMYTGCIGYISDHGQMDLNIAIRTLEQSVNQIQASFGGGIVYDSLSDQEYQECLDKAHPFLNA